MNELTIDHIERLVDQGLYPFGSCLSCQAVQAIRPLSTTIGLVAICVVCGRNVATSSLLFMDRTAAKERLGWEVEPDTPTPLLN